MRNGAMSKVLSPHKQQQMVARQRPLPVLRQVGTAESNGSGNVNVIADVDAVSDASGEILQLSMEDHLNTLDYTSGSSIIEFLAKEQDCNIEADDPDIIFREISRLSDSNDTRSVDELLQEAERLIQQQLRLSGGDGGDINFIDGLQLQFKAGPVACPLTDRQTPSSASPLSLSSPQNSIKLNTFYTRSIETSPNAKPSVDTPQSQTQTQTQTQTHSPIQTQRRGQIERQTESPVQLPAQTPKDHSNCGGSFVAFVDSLPSESIISEESTPKDMQNHTITAEAMAQLQLEQLDNTDDDEDTVSSSIYDLTLSLLKGTRGRT